MCNVCSLQHFSNISLVQELHNVYNTREKDMLKSYYSNCKEKLNRFVVRKPCYSTEKFAYIFGANNSSVWMYKLNIFITYVFNSLLNYNIIKSEKIWGFN